jgi:hypothetical protein
MSVNTPSYLGAAQQAAKDNGALVMMQQKKRERPRYTAYSRQIPLPYSAPIFALSTGDIRRVPSKASGTNKWHFKILSMADVEDAKTDETTGRRYIEIERKLSKDARLEYARLAKEAEGTGNEPDITFDNVTMLRIYEFSDISLRIKSSFKAVPPDTIVILKNVHISHWFSSGKFIDLHNGGSVTPMFDIGPDGLLFEFLANSPSICDNPIVLEHLGAKYIKSCKEHAARGAAFMEKNGPDADMSKVPDFRLKYGDITYFLSTFGRDATMQAAKVSTDAGVIIENIFTGRNDVKYDPEAFNKTANKKENVIGLETNILGEQWSGKPLGDENTKRENFLIFANAFSGAVDIFRIPKLSTWKDFGPILCRNIFVASCRENMRESATLVGMDEDDGPEYSFKSNMHIDTLVCNLPYNLATTGLPISKEKAAKAVGFLRAPSSDGNSATFNPMLDNQFHSECRHSGSDDRAADVICLNFYSGATEKLLENYLFFAITNQDYTNLQYNKMAKMTPKKLSVLADQEAAETYYNICAEGSSSPTYEDEMAEFEKKYDVDRNMDSDLLGILESVKDLTRFEILVYAVKKPELLYKDLTKEKCEMYARLFNFEYNSDGKGDFVTMIADAIRARAYPEDDENDLLKRSRDDTSEQNAMETNAPDDILAPEPAEKKLKTA